MKTLGLDIGTTSISAVVYDTEAGLLEGMSVKNDSFLTGEVWERIQSPQRIEEIATELIISLLGKHPDIKGLGVTGQMHGILYLDADGKPVSPLYTWQDGRGDLPFDESHTWAQHLSKITSHPLSTGYGMVTHYFNVRTGLVPSSAVTFCTIQDYLSMKLAGNSAPLLDPTNAASFGLFDAENGCFVDAAIKKAGIDIQMLPKLAKVPHLGVGPCGIPVFSAIGDNQASFLGAADGRTDVVLINMGTGGQVSVFSPVYLQTEALETRPFPGGGWLLVGASLCGGRSYAIVEKFFREAIQLMAGADVDVYEAMARVLLDHPRPEHLPFAETTFQGTRKNPKQRGTIRNLSEDTFTPVHLIYSILEGMARELFEMYQGYLEQCEKAPKTLIGSGNGLRKNKHLCKTFEAVFCAPMTLSPCEEEAACGAAIYAAKNL